MKDEFLPFKLIIVMATLGMYFGGNIGNSMVNASIFAIQVSVAIWLLFMLTDKYNRELIKGFNSIRSIMTSSSTSSTAASGLELSKQSLTKEKTHVSG